MHIDRSQSDVGVFAPDRVEQFPSGKDASWTLHEKRKEAKFDRPQVHHFAAPGDAMTGRVEREVTYGKHLARESGPNAPHDCEGFGLTAHELDLIRTLPAHSRCFLIRQPDASVVVRLDLSGMPEVLTVLSGRESTVRRLDALRAEYGDAPAAWYPALTGELWLGEAEDGDEGAGPLWVAAAE